MKISVWFVIPTEVGSISSSFDSARVMGSRGAESDVTPSSVFTGTLCRLPCGVLPGSRPVFSSIESNSLGALDEVPWLVCGGVGLISFEEL